MCVPCKVGEFQQTHGEAGCRPCAPGHYGALAGTAQCEACGAGSFQPATGSSACSLCPEGEYQSSPAADTCKRCSVGHDSLDGSAACAFCASGYYRPRADSPVAECRACDALDGVSCGRNSTIATLSLAQGYWRHSTATIQTHRCRADGAWSPCRGGLGAGNDGDGYCEDGYRGPRCELCDGPAYSRHFDKLSASCNDCGDVSARSTVVACTVFVLLLAGVGLIATIHSLEGSARCGALVRWISGALAVWRAAGMRYKVKALVGFYQCISAVPSVFNVVAPVGLEQYTRWIDLLELPSELESIFVASACLGEYHERVLLSSSWPILFILVFAAGFIGWELLQAHRPASSAASLGVQSAVMAGLQR
eukprot:1442362-Prymnesium_polylepis.1